jgi:signal transduction histidine kinase
MVLGNETVGWICVRSSRADPSDFESKIHLAEALANQATLAVQMARLGERAREAAVLGERNRIARDIHDTLAQGFTAVVLNLQAAERTLRKDERGQALEHIEHACNLARSCLDEARLSVRALRPESALAQLIPAMEAQARRFDVSGVRASFEVRGTPAVLPGEAHAELLRIAQECITNVLKHARARMVRIALAYEAGALSLSVVDDGIGFDPCACHDGFGLVGMRERAERIGARLTVTSGPAQGTCVETALSLGPGALPEPSPRTANVERIDLPGAR